MNAALAIQAADILELNAASCASTSQEQPTFATFAPDSTEPFDYRALLVGDGEKRKPNGVMLQTVRVTVQD